MMYVFIILFCIGLGTFLGKKIDSNWENGYYYYEDYEEEEEEEEEYYEEESETKEDTESNKDSELKDLDDLDTKK